MCSHSTNALNVGNSDLCAIHHYPSHLSNLLPHTNVSLIIPNWKASVGVGYEIWYAARFTDCHHVFTFQDEKTKGFDILLFKGTFNP